MYGTDPRRFRSPHESIEHGWYIDDDVDASMSYMVHLYVKCY